MIARLMGLDTISPTDLHQLIQAKRVVVFDVTSPSAWAAGHVPSAVNLDSSAFTEAQLPASKDENLVFYCSNSMCRKAPVAARRARSMGFTNVKVMSAGIAGWRSSRLPLEQAG
ncbi:MAG TPA: rhodanese-like domain-containing protein [Gemmatimonadales bacterium]|nr:rhodanese-like domain-containing protein [Gemmatimonadales bacterium]